jgi:hypothetical protein
MMRSRLAQMQHSSLNRKSSVETPSDDACGLNLFELNILDIDAKL